MVEERKAMVHFDQIEDKKEKEEKVSELLNLAFMGAPDFLNFEMDVPPSPVP
jgi:hypothetical protein